MKDLLWLIPLFPLLGADRQRPGRQPARLGAQDDLGASPWSAPGSRWLAAFAAIADWATTVGTHAVHVNRVFTWIPARARTHRGRAARRPLD